MQLEIPKQKNKNATNQHLLIIKKCYEVPKNISKSFFRLSDETKLVVDTGQHSYEYEHTLGLPTGILYRIIRYVLCLDVVWL